MVLVYLLMLKKNDIYRLNIRSHSVYLFIGSSSEITWFDLNCQVDWAGVWHG